jgi:hypothetical protein
MMIKETSRNLQRQGNNGIRGGVLFQTQMNSVMLINSYDVSCCKLSNGGVFFVKRSRI